MFEHLQRRYTLLLLFLVSMFNHIERAILSITQVPARRDAGLSEAQLRLLTALPNAVVSTVCLPVARRADRGNRIHFIAGLLSSVLAMRRDVSAGSIRLRSARRCCSHSPTAHCFSSPRHTRAGAGHHCSVVPGVPLARPKPIEFPS